MLDGPELDPRTRTVPVIIRAAHALAEDERRRPGQEAAAILPKDSLTRELAIGRIRDVLASAVGGDTERRSFGGV